jgi:hypothetical protein
LSKLKGKNPKGKNKMTLENVQKILSEKKRGTYFTIVYKSTYGEYAKTTTTTIRLCNYYNVVKKEPQQGAKKSTNDKYLGNNLIFNENTQKTRLQVFLTNCKNHTPRNVYEYQGNEITSVEFYEGTHKKPSNVSVMFTIDINNIVAIY